MFVKQKMLPDVTEVKKLLPIGDELETKKQNFDEQLRQNLKSKDKFVVVCGPCSADDPVAVAEYLSKLKAVADDCKNLLVVARVYTAKPRSNGAGYKGLAFGLQGEDVAEGILACRQMMLDCLRIGLPIADELLYPELYQYFDDLVSYSFLGARSGEDSLHRAFASGLDICCGIKNATDGDVDKVAQSVQAVSMATVFPFDGSQIKTTGCSFAHAVLRGGVVDGKFFSNINNADTTRLKQNLLSCGLNDFIMADLSHANSQKVARNQIDNAKMVVSDKNVNGVMIESYLYDGCGCGFGVSKTDECLSFEDTRDLLKMLDQCACK